MMKIFRKYWPLIIAIGLLWVTTGILLTISVRQNQGHLVYTLDDPYIHMAVAKNFSRYGVWNTNKEGFASLSSSLLWTLLLSSVYSLFGVNELTPFILNFIFGSLLVILAYYFLRKYISRNSFIFGILVAIIFFTPLCPLMFCGQEHILQIIIVISFVFLSSKVLSREIVPLNKISLLILTPLVTLIRYEGIFLILVVCILYVLHKKYLYSFFLGILGIIPITIYGMISVLQGWYFLPNSIIMKGNILHSMSSAGINHFLDVIYKQIVLTPHILLLILIALFIFIFQNNKQKDMGKDVRIMTIIFIAIAVLHTLFAKVGWFYRYEAYLVALGIVVISIGIHVYLSKKPPLKNPGGLLSTIMATVLLIVIIILPFAVRGIGSLIKTPRATTNIYEQQYQMGLFLEKFYKGENVAANDIGTISYLAEISCFDLWGLSSLEVLKLKLQQNYNTHYIHELSKQNNIKIAVVYDSWFKIYGGLPPWWIKVGEWQILNNVVCSDDKVSFYAVEPSAANDLVENMKAFSLDLPEFVLQSWWSNK